MGLAVGIGVLVIGGLLLDVRDFTGLAAAVGGAAALAAAQMLGRYTRSAWTAAALPTLWVALVVILSVTTGNSVTPRRWIAVAGVAISFLAFWAIGRGVGNKPFKDCCDTGSSLLMGHGDLSSLEIECLGRSGRGGAAQ